MNIRILFTIGFILIALIWTGTSFGQQKDYKEYDVFLDTLLLINGKTINTERILMNRKEVVEADTFKINQKGLVLKSFTIQAITLGHSVELTTDKPIFSGAMKNEILNKQSNFKFIYIKDINLQTSDGRTVKPSLEVIKIIFNN